MSAPTIDPPDLARVAEFRQKYRKEVIGPLYHGYWHIAIVIVGSLAVIGWAASQLGYDKQGNVRPLVWQDWAVIPLTLFIANIVEYIGHRGPMHHKKRNWFLKLLFHRHTEEHHQFFTEDSMTCISPKDFKIVLFPPLMLFVYLGLVAFPASAIVYFLTTQNGACMALASSMFYFLSYEVLHFSYHMHEDSFIGRMWLVRVLREHHRIHHNQKLMADCNFNITWPIADFLFGTIHTEKKREAKEGTESGKAAENNQSVA